MLTISRNFVRIKNTTFPATVTKTVIGVIILKTILFLLSHKMFRRLPIKYHDMNKRWAGSNFYLTKNKTVQCTSPKILWPQAVAWFAWLLRRSRIDPLFPCRSARSLDTLLTELSQLPEVTNRVHETSPGSVASTNFGTAHQSFTFKHEYFQSCVFKLS
jgi:hypothetical protein